MTPAINCDDVFKLLTRGPFPSGDPLDGAAELHLITCSDCRRLAEALRPAYGVFHEAVPSLELDSLPGYRGVLCSVERAIETIPNSNTNSESDIDPMSRSLPDREQRSPISRHLTWLFSDLIIGRFVAVMLMVLGVSGWLWAVGLLPAGPSNSVEIHSLLDERELLTKNPLAGSRYLATLAIPAQCREASPPRLSKRDGELRPVSSPSLTGSSQQCCTQCHSATNRLASAPESMRTITASCAACHSR